MKFGGIWCTSFNILLIYYPVVCMYLSLQDTTLEQMQDVLRKQSWTIYSSNHNSDISLMPSGYSANTFIGKSSVLSV